jgi:hypothetical protein
MGPATYIAVHCPPQSLQQSTAEHRSFYDWQYKGPGWNASTAKQSPSQLIGLGPQFFFHDLFTALLVRSGILEMNSGLWDPQCGTPPS